MEKVTECSLFFAGQSSRSQNAHRKTSYKTAKLPKANKIYKSAGASACRALGLATFPSTSTSALARYIEAIHMAREEVSLTWKS